MVAAAFIGPGTVTACTLAGAGFGYALLWALLFATVATIGLQEMAARLGVVGRMGLGEAIRAQWSGAALRIPMVLLVLSALVVGNAAYEGGNLAGAALGVEAAVGDRAPFAVLVGAIAVAAGALLLFGRYKMLVSALTGVVVLMAAAFAGAFALSKPDLGALFAGFTPRLPDGGLLTAVALIGTTIVPYNLFLHSAAAKVRWPSAEDLPEARLDLMIAVGLGGIVSMLIVATGASTLYGAGVQPDSAADFARQLEPLAGPGARWLMAAGLFAAGLTSAITAPLATAFATTEILGLRSDPGSPAFRAIAFGILAVGATTAMTGLRPVTLILFAQVANGLLLPIVATFLLAAMNAKGKLGEHRNNRAANTFGIMVILISLGLGVRMILHAAGIL